MEPGPLPPHERSWRHPSELGPTRVDVDAGPSHFVPAFALGALAVIAVAGLVVAMTPRSNSAPMAISATTMAPAPALAAADPGRNTGPNTGPNTDRNTTTVSANRAAGMPIGALMTSFAVFPHAVTSAPTLTLDGTGIAPTVPDDDDVVLVRTDAVTYHMPWDQVPLLDAADGTVVFTTDGELVAHVRSGELISLVDD
ncbi:MAG TPA: hypothetical protein VK853_05750 [Ilumatobacteraceae bacterium]|nr:hypothetical protein [Ilumatobacteraceae bacterium]